MFNHVNTATSFPFLAKQGAGKTFKKAIINVNEPSAANGGHKPTLNEWSSIHVA
jgi:hypothetical protein